jgi:hypothetical protein
MNWGSVGRGFASVADDIARSQMGKRIGDEYVDDVLKTVGRNMNRLSADDAAQYMAEAQDDAARWYAKFVEPNGQIPVDENEILYRIGRGAAHTGQFARNHSGTALNLGMNAMFLAPMAMQMLPRSQEEQIYG